MQWIQHGLHARPWLSPLFLLFVTFLAFFIATPTFLTANSMGILLQQTAVVAALAIGQTLVILTADIDLSVGAIMILSMMIMASLARDGGMFEKAGCIATQQDHQRERDPYHPGDYIVMRLHV